MPPCSVVVLDLDGTLLRSDRTVSDASAELLQRLRSQGVILIIATARPRRAVRPLLPATLLDDWVVLYNGSQIWHRDRLVQEWTLAPAALRRLVEAATAACPAAPIGCEHQDQLFVTRHFDRHWSAEAERMVDVAALPATGVFKIVVDLVDAQLEMRLRAALSADCRMVVTDSGTLAQIMPAGTSKAAAVRFIVRRLERRMDEVICFGDDHNDADLFAVCAHSVAMANAPPSIRRLAAYQTSSNDEDGVARYLRTCYRL
jgi:Cof subfamily protein (haloacid dehalogenase superfamily)